MYVFTKQVFKEYELDNEASPKERSTSPYATSLKVIKMVPKGLYRLIINMLTDER